MLTTVRIVLSIAALVTTTAVESPRQMHPYITKANATCLATNIYHEASGESFAGKVAVTKVAINRGGTCKVIFAPYQFSWTLKTKQLRKPTLEDLRIIFTAHGAQFSATHYHAQSVRPHWAKKLEYVTTIGNHKFYVLHRL